MPDPGAFGNFARVAGIEVSHRAADGITLGDFAASPRPQPDDAVVVTHKVGRVDISGMELIFAVPPGLSYYRDAAGQTVVCRQGDGQRGTRTVLTTERPGFDYTVNYDTPPREPVQARACEVSAYSLALAARKGGILAHGCGLVLPNGLGALCLGVSGAGKSTLAKMMLDVANVRVLNDDRNVVTADRGRMTLWSTPWPGNAGIANEGHAPLGVVALIAQARVPSVRKLPAREALPRLLRTVLLPIWSETEAAPELAIVDLLCRTVPIIEISYPLSAQTPGWITEQLIGWTSP